MMAYQKERGVSLWPYDIAAQDTAPDVNTAQFERRTIAEIHMAGRGIVQFHDWSKVTVDGLDDILSDAKRSGFKIVQPVAGSDFAPKPEYMAAIASVTPHAQTTHKSSPGDATRQKLRIHSQEEPQTYSHAWQGIITPAQGSGGEAERRSW